MCIYVYAHSHTYVIVSVCVCDYVYMFFFSLFFPEMKYGRVLLQISIFLSFTSVNIAQIMKREYGTSQNLSPVALRKGELYTVELKAKPLVGKGFWLLRGGRRRRKLPPSMEASKY